MLNVPVSFVAGDRVVWRSSQLRGLDPSSGLIVDYLPERFSLVWQFSDGTNVFSVLSVADQSDYVTALEPEQTAPLQKALYYQVFIQDQELNRRGIFSGSIKVVPLAEEAFNGRSTAQELLDLVEAAIKTILAGGAVQSYSIKGRNLSRMSMGELVALRSSLKIEAARERSAEAIANGLGDPRKLFVRFTQY